MSLPVHGVLRAVVAVGAGAALVAGASALPGTDLSSRAPSEDPGARTAVRSSSVVCPGPELQGVEGIDDRPVDVVAAATSPPASLVADLDPSTSDGMAGLSTLTGDEVGDPVTEPGVVTTSGVRSGALKASASEALAPGLSASQQWLVSTGDDRSLGSVPCSAATAEAWLLAGGGDPGRQERLVLTNPSTNPVTVDVTLHGTQGVVDSPNGDGIVVPAQSRTSVLLDSISATEATPAVHVVASGGLVQAVLNDHWLDGTVPAGSDDAARSADPSREQVIPGVALAGRGAVRVVVPGSDEAVVQVRALTATGPVALSTGGVVRAPGESTVDIPLTGLPDGVLGLQVRADVDVVAGAVVVHRSGSEPGDIAWSSSTPAIDTLAGAALAPVGTGGATRGLSLVSTGGTSEVEVVTTDAAGTETRRQLSVPADGAVSLALDSSSSVWVRPTSGDGEVRAGVVTRVSLPDGPLVTSLPLVQPTLTTRSVGLLDLG